MTLELAKQFDPAAAQKNCLELWDRLDLFHAPVDPTRPSFSMVIPPPNVTGALHLGHALNNTLQDILVRQHRMMGYDTLWMPGTDHAGIATQAVVERRIRVTENKTRHEIGREELVRRIWEWKDQYGSRILNQLRELGCSCDWKRARFTLDETCARAVRQAFFNLFKSGLVYRGKRLVNWDTQLQTSVADDETFVETIKGGFWTFRYPLVDGDGFIRFSTTRPETMLGDTAVAVHPEDPRYKDLIGKMVTVPLTGRQIPIIGDAILVKPEMGTGAVKVTPAHDRNDNMCAQRHGLEMINILETDGTINATGGIYAGLDRYVARERVVEDMEKLGLFDGREDRDIEMAHSDRSKSPIEPFLSDQWFVSMDRLAEDAMAAVRDGKVRIVPERYATTYLDWLSEKRDWCISRQLWWGHRIPIWHVRCPEEILKNALTGREDVVYQPGPESGTWYVCALADLPEDLLGSNYPLVRDPDVLDTWFSSALWPFSTLGWPDKTPELARYYPTSVLVTSREIITLWVARMVLFGVECLGEVPFRSVYIHPKILDGFGETMSKSKGNGVDPLDIIEQYGPDALRFQMALMATETQDARMPVGNICPHCAALMPVKQEHLCMRTRKVTCPGCKKTFRPGGPWLDNDEELLTAKQGSDRFEQGRNFATKVWNASRFILMNLEGFTPGLGDITTLAIEDRWILARLARAADAVTSSLAEFRYAEAMRTLYEFTWTDFCDWYLEMAKGRLKEQGTRADVQRVLVGVLDGLIRLLHPFLPFLTETLWQALNEAVPERSLTPGTVKTETIGLAAWPAYPSTWRDATVEGPMARMQELVRFVRDVRNRTMLDPRQTVELRVRSATGPASEIRNLESFLALLAGTSPVVTGPEVVRAKFSASKVFSDMEASIPLEGLIDPAAEKVRLEKQLAERKKALESTRTRLGNPAFVDKAPAEVVAQLRQQLGELEEQVVAIQAGLTDLG